MSVAVDAARDGWGHHVQDGGRSSIPGGMGWRIPGPRGGTGDSRPPGATPPAGLRPLNGRDRELLRHLAQGKSTAQIAAAMSVSSNTARTRIRRISAKLAVTDRREVVDAARVLGLV